MKIYQWSKIYTRYDKSINCEHQTHIFFPGNCYGRKISHSIKTDVRICEAWIHTRHLNEEQKGVDFHKKNIAGIHHKIPWLFPDFPPFKDFPWLFTEFPDFSLTLKNIFFPWLFPDRWQPCRVTHMCVRNLTINGSDNGLSPGQRQAIIWTNVGMLLIRP